MERSAFVKSLPRIPDFHSMPKALAAYKLSPQGRQETIDIRNKYLAQISRRQREQNQNEGRSSLQEDKHNNNNNNNPMRASPCSAPPGFRVKDGSRRDHVVLCATRPRRMMSKKTYEERARQRVKDYIAKQIYKIPTSQRPEFFVKVHVDPRPSPPYPQGTLPSAKCHFNYVTPKKFLDDNYKEALGKSTTQNSELNAQKLTSSEVKRNILIENLISSSSCANNKPDSCIGEEANNKPFTNASNTTETSYITSNTNTNRNSAPPQTPSTKSLTAILTGKEKNCTVLDEHNFGTKTYSTLQQQRNKSVTFSVPDSKYHSTIRRSNNNSTNEFSIDGSRTRSAMANGHAERSRMSTANRKGLTPADIASAHARHHFIHPELPSEFINWARYSHPKTSERLRHSYM